MNINYNKKDSSQDESNTMLEKETYPLKISGIHSNTTSSSIPTFQLPQSIDTTYNYQSSEFDPSINYDQPQTSAYGSNTPSNQPIYYRYNIPHQSQPPQIGHSVDYYNKYGLINIPNNPSAKLQSSNNPTYTPYYTKFYPSINYNTHQILPHSSNTQSENPTSFPPNDYGYDNAQNYPSVGSNINQTPTSNQHQPHTSAIRFERISTDSENDQDVQNFFQSNSNIPLTELLQNPNIPYKTRTGQNDPSIASSYSPGSGHISGSASTQSQPLTDTAYESQSAQFYSETGLHTPYMQKYQLSYPSSQSAYHVNRNYYTPSNQYTNTPSHYNPHTSTQTSNILVSPKDNTHGISNTRNFPFPISDIHQQQSVINPDLQKTNIASSNDATFVTETTGFSNIPYIQTASYSEKNQPSTQLLHNVYIPHQSQSSHMVPSASSYIPQEPYRSNNPLAELYLPVHTTYDSEKSQFQPLSTYYNQNMPQSYNSMYPSDQSAPSYGKTYVSQPSQSDSSINYNDPNTLTQDLNFPSGQANAQIFADNQYQSYQNYQYPAVNSFTSSSQLNPDKTIESEEESDDSEVSEQESNAILTQPTNSKNSKYQYIPKNTGRSSVSYNPYTPMYSLNLPYTQSAQPVDISLKSSHSQFHPLAGHHKPNDLITGETPLRGESINTISKNYMTQPTYFDPSATYNTPYNPIDSSYLSKTHQKSQSDISYDTDATSSSENSYRSKVSKSGSNVPSDQQLPNVNIPNEYSQTYNSMSSNDPYSSIYSYNSASIQSSTNLNADDESQNSLQYPYTANSLSSTSYSLSSQLPQPIPASKSSSRKRKPRTVFEDPLFPKQLPELTGEDVEATLLNLNSKPKRSKVQQPITSPSQKDVEEPLLTTNQKDKTPRAQQSKKNSQKDVEETYLSTSQKDKKPKAQQAKKNSQKNIQKAA